MTQSAPADAIDAVLAEHADLERQLSDPELHGDAANARRVGKRFAQLAPIAATYRKLDAARGDLEAARELAAADAGRFDSPEMRCVRPLLDLQRERSALPTPDRLLGETFKSRDGHHLFLYPFAGRNVHLGLASLLAWRAAQAERGTFSIAVNDYGFELLSAKPVDWAARLSGWLAAPVDVAEVLAGLNATELARRRFREIARIAGLIFQSHPGENRSNRQLQASSSLFFEVFQKYDPGNRLLAQAEQELLNLELDVQALSGVLARLQLQSLKLVDLSKPSPLAFPLMVERLRERLSNESLADRIARMVADGEGGP